MAAKIKAKTQRAEKGSAKQVRTTEAEAQRSAATPNGSHIKPVTKTAGVVILLSRADGATLPEIIKITGWQPHSARAALTGLRKKGHKVERTKRDDLTCYRILGNQRL